MAAAGMAPLGKIKVGQRSQSPQIQLLTSEPTAVVKANELPSPVRRRNFHTVTRSGYRHYRNAPAQDEASSDQLVDVTSRRDDGHSDNDNNSTGEHSPFATKSVTRFRAQSRSQATLRNNSPVRDWSSREGAERNWKSASRETCCRRSVRTQ